MWTSWESNVTMDEVALLSQGSFQKGLPKAPQQWEGLTPSILEADLTAHVKSHTKRLSRVSGVTKEVQAVPEAD